MAAKKIKNEEIADLLEQIADLLDVQEANRFRIQAYRDGAESVRTAENSIAQLARDEGEKGLQALPDIGEGIARVIYGYVQSGRSEFLEELQGGTAPGTVFQQVPGIGPKLAERIAEELDITTLQELEQAAHDGRLESLKGFGPEMVRNVQVSVSGMLSTAAQRSRRQAGGEAKPQTKPEIGALLEVDEEYRRKAGDGELKKIAPKRFNPEGKAWLPVLNTERGGWEFTALFSNTAQAHELEKTDDWVVLFYKRNGDEEQATVVTETRGKLEGKRVVRGREDESQAYYEEK
jgi:DNA polymerase (family X)